MLVNDLSYCFIPETITFKIMDIDYYSSLSKKLAFYVNEFNTIIWLLGKLNSYKFRGPFRLGVKGPL